MPGDVRMNNHACSPGGTVTPMDSALPHRPALVPLPVQVTVPSEKPDGEAPAGTATKPNETLSVTAVAAMAADVLKRGPNRPKIFMVPSPCPSVSGSPSQVRRATLKVTPALK